MLVTDTKKCIKSPCVILRHDCRFYTRTKDLICKRYWFFTPNITAIYSISINKISF